MHLTDENIGKVEVRTVVIEGSVVSSLDTLRCHLLSN